MVTWVDVYQKLRQKESRQNRTRNVKKGENSGSASFKNICLIRCAALTWDGNANQTDASPVQIHDLF